MQKNDTMKNGTSHIDFMEVPPGLLCYFLLNEKAERFKTVQ